MQRHEGAWVGWDGGRDGPEEPFDAGRDDGWSRSPLSGQEIEEFYEGFSNAHPVAALPRRRRQAASSTASGGTPTSRVNRRFAERAAEQAAQKAMVWVHDYQLQLVPAMLRELRPDLRIGFFLHIPFPPSELFVQLPWRAQILEGLLGADLVGFQRTGGAQNFVRLMRAAAGPQDPPRADLPRPTAAPSQAKCFPISIDYDELAELSRSEPTIARAKEIRAQLGDPRLVLLGVDRLDYTKGIFNRLRAFGELLEEGRLERRGRRLRAGRDALARAGAGVPPAARRDRAAGGADQRRPRPHRTTGDLATCTPPTRARRWPRSSAPPTSWSSPRCATG